MEAISGRLGNNGMATTWLPAAGFALAAATIGYGFAARASGTELGASLAPFLWDWRPRAHPLALPAAALLALGASLAPRLRSPALGPLAFAGLTLALGLALRLALASARAGTQGLWDVYRLGNHEAGREYLPALPALDFGARFFLDTFAEVGASLPVHAVGHPPGLLLMLHALGIEGPRGMAALTIGAGALAIPLTYLLSRALLDEQRARSAALLYVFAPSAALYGATSADALYATVALAAAIPLALAVRRAPAGGALPLGAGLLALASFFSYANLAIGAWATVLAAYQSSVRRALTVAVACGVALALFYGALALATGYDPIGALRATESVYREGIAARRPYAFWVFGSPVAFLVALGPPIAWFALRSTGAREPAAVALVAVVVVAAVLGFSKAETERIYQFLVPLACIAAAITLPPQRLPITLAALAAQALAVELLLYTVW